MSGAHDEIKTAEVEDNDDVNDYDSPDEDETQRNQRPAFIPADIDLPPEVGAGVGKLPPFNPDAEEPAKHVYAKIHLVAQQRLKTRLPFGSKVITPGMCARIKQEGTEAVEKKNWELAQGRFEDAAMLILRDVLDAKQGDFKGEFADNKDLLHLMNTCFLNSAMCLLKFAEDQTHTEARQSLWKRAEYHTTVCLANKGRPLKPDIGVKAYFRRGCARMYLRKWNLAIADFKNAVKCDPRSRDVRVKLNECIKLRDKEMKAEREFFSMEKLRKALEREEAKKKDEKDGEVWSAARAYAVKGQEHDAFAQSMGLARPLSVMDDDVDD